MFLGNKLCRFNKLSKGALSQVARNLNAFPLRWISNSNSNNPSENEPDAAEAYPIRFKYQGEILDKFHVSNWIKYNM